jgi:hypothetical protein
MCIQSSAQDTRNPEECQRHVFTPSRRPSSAGVKSSRYPRPLVLRVGSAQDAFNSKLNQKQKIFPLPLNAHTPKNNHFLGKLPQEHIVYQHKHTFTPEL